MTGRKSRQLDDKLRALPRPTFSLAEIKAEDWTLNISRYGLPSLSEDIPRLNVALADFKIAWEKCGK